MSTSKKLFMALVVTVAFFGILELVLALAGIEPRLFAEDPYVGFSSQSPLFEQSQDGATFRTAQNKLNLFNEQEFASTKAAGTTRVFCVGGSTTNGRPYDDLTSFCGWLRELLPAADPSTRWEVVNAGGVSYASYRVAMLMEELVHYEPDLFVVYSGHNEFLEERTYRDIISMPRALRGMGAIAAHTRIHAAVNMLVDSVRRQGEASVEPTVMSDAVTTLLDSSVGPSAFTRDDVNQQRIIGHFRFNLARMVDIAESVGAEVVLVVPASNLADCTPFKSEYVKTLDDTAQQEFKAAISKAQEAYASENLEQTLENLEVAKAVDDRVAGRWYFEGLTLMRMGRFEEAKSAFERARDDDVCPLRILGPMTDVVREVAVDRAVPLVDFEGVVATKSANGIAGKELFLDHVHPTIEGNLLLARSILDVLVDVGFVDPSSSWGDEEITRISQSVNSKIDQTAHGLALMKLSKVLGWAGKLREAYDLAQRAVALAPGDVRVEYQAGLTAHLVGQRREAVEHYRRAIGIQPDVDLPRQNLGVLLKEAGRPQEAAEQFRLAIQNARTEKTRLDNVANLSEALVMLGFVHYQKGRFDEAESSFKEADTLVPGKPDILVRLGLAQMASGKRTEAVQSLEKAAAIAGADATIHNRLAVAYASNGQMDLAEQSWQEAVRLDPEIVNANDAFPKVIKAVRGG